MRLGIFSDVHANEEALSAVMAAYADKGVDAFYCVGDVVGYGGSPEACADMVRESCTATILGNHDAAVAGRMDYSYYYPAARRALDLHAARLSQRNIEWLRSLPYKHEEPDLDLQLCHGSPVRLEEFEYIFAPEQARECLAIWESLPQLTVIGHSHLCKVFALKPGRVEELPAESFELRPDWKYIVSDGSVGQPRDFDPRASYTLFDTERRAFEFHRVEYDIEAAASRIEAAGLESHFAERLRLGV